MCLCKKVLLPLLLLSVSAVSNAQNGTIRTFDVKGQKFNMVEIEGGTFTMGGTKEQGNDADADEQPVHSVTLSAFCMSQTEVTQELWEAVMGNNPSIYKGKKHPVENIMHSDALQFIEKLNNLTGKTFRLPTEAEWEFAARGGTLSQGYKYAGSDDINAVAWYGANSYDGKEETDPGYGYHDVATKAPNELGLYDMSGNVWEFCQDWYGDYSDKAQTNPNGPAEGTDYVERGGSWTCVTEYCRVSHRNYENPFGHGDTGIRLVLGR
ncbi:MAG: SUMF1/EgtB/PvdO family nonheme iron enzyme [Bacteroidaceae bacterium]|nr:SUMF1/EgtB/PvdO family nonheme iron enzyme [Bacteroidaceae bacterium]